MNDDQLIAPAMLYNPLYGGLNGRGSPFFPFIPGFLSLETGDHLLKEDGDHIIVQP